MITHKIKSMGIKITKIIFENFNLPKLLEMKFYDLKIQIQNKGLNLIVRNSYDKISIHIRKLS